MGRERVQGVVVGAAFTAVALLVAGSGAASAGPVIPAPVDKTVYRSCVNLKTGAMRFLLSGTTCKTGEKLVTWKATGATGPAGPQGPAGPAGPQGPAGPAGTSAGAALPAGYSARGSTASLALFVDGGTEVTALDLPTGRYQLVTAVNILNASSPDMVAWADCALSDRGTAVTEGRVTVAAQPLAGGNLTMLGTVAGPTRVAVRCSRGSAAAGGGVLATAVIQATQIAP